ncbi:hypothetical protein BV509_01010 [Rhodovulum sulfidophilum]|nr:hypothetical protein [Rhodovulum visakhapatnamense]OLS43068.1 hypothetical protein BV509_01010 [Rhodovulum sulfidophilum]
MMTCIDPGAAQVAHARTIVLNPGAYAHRLSIRLHAWAVLKTARGQTVRAARLQQMQRTENHRGLAFDRQNEAPGGDAA